jgi:hypothetical protein
MNAKLHTWIARGAHQLRGVGPYVAIALLLPGGSLVALVLWMYRQIPSRVYAPLASLWIGSIARIVAPAPDRSNRRNGFTTDSAPASKAAEPRPATCNSEQ